MNKKVYQTPTTTVTALAQRYTLLSESQQGGPSADFMSNPGISSAKSRNSRWDDDEQNYDETLF